MWEYLQQFELEINKVIRVKGRASKEVVLMLEDFKSVMKEALNQSGYKAVLNDLTDKDKEDK
jgi:hypothetical protein